MKAIITFILLLTVTYANSQAKKQYILNGKITGKESGTMYLRYQDEGMRKIDSGKIKNGHFLLTGYISEPVLAIVSDVNGNLPNNYLNVSESFYIDPAKMNILMVNEQFKIAQIRGSKTNDEWTSITKIIYPFIDSIHQVQTDDSINYFNRQICTNVEYFSNKHSNSIISARIIAWLSRYGLSNDSTLYLLNSLDNEVKKTYTFQLTKEGISISINSEINHKAPDFTRTDLTGKTLRLSDFKGKYLLLDYWASWCIPCREISPHLKELYKKYHLKGLEVIAISCDSKYMDWQRAIKEDSIYLFHNILSFTDADMNLLKTKTNITEASFKGELRKLYNLMPIPAQILIDKNGIIVGRFEGSIMQDLDNKLKEVFDD